MKKIMRRNLKTESELWAAVRLLAHWSNNIKERLANAYEFHIIYINDDDMPTEDLKKKILNVQAKLTKNHTQTVREAIRNMRLKTCSAIADDICNVYDGYTHFEWRE
jgi:hypothetical protein